MGIWWHGCRNEGFRLKWPDSRARGLAAVASLASLWKRSVVVRARKRAVVGCFLSCLVLAAGCDKNRSPTAPSAPDTIGQGDPGQQPDDPGQQQDDPDQPPTSDNRSPDLVVVSPSVTDSSPDAGASFTLSATVRNDGDGEASATTLRFYRSSDSTITMSDTEVGTAAVAGLAASGSGSESVDLTVPSSAGRYYYGACVDAVADESDTANNCSMSVQVDVREPVSLPQTSAPDLVVVSPSVTDSSPDAGASFTLSATVRNDGDGEASATTLRFYRSSDSTITMSDTEVGTAAVAGLAASGSGSESVDLTVPSSAGRYYYGACVDAVADESDTANNCSMSVQVDVREPVSLPQTSAPDLVVVSPSVTDSSPDAGASFTLSAMVRNDGDGEASATTLRFYRSSDSTITTADTEVGTAAVPTVPTSVSISRSTDVTAPASAGTYYFGACVDAVSQESDTGNNCSTSVQVDVRELVARPQTTAPELVVVSPSVTDSRPETGASFTLSATVRNDGDGEASATTLRFYRSSDSTITTSDTEVGTAAVPTVPTSVSISRSTDVTAPASAGTYYFGACVDAVSEESDTGNNCSTSVQVDVRELVARPQTSAPDLVVVSPSVTDSSPDAGAPFTLSAMVRNDGDGEASATTLRFYRSSDSTITTSDTEVGTAAVPTVPTSVSISRSTDVTAPASAGTYYFGACVDAVSQESDTGNNCSTSVQVDVRELVARPQTTAPELVVVSPSVTDSRPETGASFTLSATVRNDGDGEASATTLRFYRSSDSTITTSDTEVGTAAVPTVPTSVSISRSTDVTAPASAGTYYFGACVDAVSEESDTGNNCSTSVQVDVRELVAQPQTSAPDLVVVSPSVTHNSQTSVLSLSAEVRNDGDGDAAATTLRFYSSSDSTITTSDTEVGTAAVPTVPASGRVSAQIVMAGVSRSAGTYYYGACVDAVSEESDTGEQLLDIRVGHCAIK